MTKKEIGKHIKFLRLKRNYSQSSLAKKANVSRATVVRIENGEESYSIDTLIDILHIFGEELYIGNDICNDKLICNITYKIEDLFLAKKNSSSRSRRDNIYGWVYIIKAINDDMVKIGFTKEDEPSDRLKNVIGYNGECELYYAQLCFDCQLTEKRLHDIFKENRIYGEWFNIDCEEVKQKLIDISKSGVSKYDLLKGIMWS